MELSGDPEESRQRARCDVEMLLAAYPDEVRVDAETRRKLGATAGGEAGASTAAAGPAVLFPLNVVLELSPTAYIELELVDGYPYDTNVQVSSYRCSPEEKARMEEAVAIIRKESNQCLEEAAEGLLSCVSMARNEWRENANAKPTHDPTILHSSATTDHGSTDPSDGGRDAVASSAVAASTYNWISGGPLQDRKSTFIAHVCRLHREADVRPALEQLLRDNPKLEKATHNMWAYRILEAVPNPHRTLDNRSGHFDLAAVPATIEVLKHDNDDDGEDAAGGRLAHLLELRKETNVLVVVSRWFGGVELGPKRFAHINNVARELLVECHETVWKDES